MPEPSAPAPTSGARPATFRTLIPIYDLSVLWFSNSFVWRCPTEQMLALYNAHISANHLDIGAGSGWSCSSA